MEAGGDGPTLPRTCDGMLPSSRRSATQEWATTDTDASRVFDDRA